VYANREDTMKTISIAALAALLAAATAVAVVRPSTAHGSAPPSDRTISVTGTAIARGAPDTAVFTFGVDTEGATAKSTLAANAAQMRRVIVALVRTGIARADIQTQNVSVYPRRTESGAVEGYSVNGSVTATVRRLARAGAAVDAAVAAGANETSGPQFDRTSRSELTQLALREAFADARTRAQTLAKEAGASLGEVRRIGQAEAPQPVPMGVYAEALTARTPIEPGTQQVQATVTVTFGLAG
jgi:uncharacterized protein